MTDAAADSVIYLDYNATTPVDPDVIEAMVPMLSREFGNPSSGHRIGAAAAAVVEQARAAVAELIGARESEIVFTSGGTEADNAALRGVLAARPSRRGVVISAIEHHAIIETAEQLEREGATVAHVGVGSDGCVDLDALARAVTAETALVSIMLANNETGVIQPVREAAEIAHRHGALLHTDAVQAAGKIPVRVDDLGVDLLSLSAHKMYGPKGAGALYVRRGTPLRPMMIGGHQERDRRGGTHNTSGIAGLGAAARLAAGRLGEEARRIRGLRDDFEQALTARFEQVHVIGAGSARLGNTSCVCFAGVEAEALLLLLSEEGICVSSGAACSSGSLEPSHVLRAMGVDAQIAQGQIRFSFGRHSTRDELDRLLAALPSLLGRLSALSG